MGGGRLPLWYLGASACPRTASPRSPPPSRPLEGVALVPAVDAPRVRRSFARLNKVLDVPNLIAIQRRLFEWLTDPEKGGLRETIDDISPIEDYTGNLTVQFGRSEERRVGKERRSRWSPYH